MVLGYTFLFFSLWIRLKTFKDYQSQRRSFFLIKPIRTTNRHRKFRSPFKPYPILDTKYNQTQTESTIIFLTFSLDIRTFPIFVIIIVNHTWSTTQFVPFRLPPNSRNTSPSLPENDYRSVGGLRLGELIGRRLGLCPFLGRL